MDVETPTVSVHPIANVALNNKIDNAATLNVNVRIATVHLATVVNSKELINSSVEIAVFQIVLSVGAQLQTDVFRFLE